MKEKFPLFFIPSEEEILVQKMWMFFCMRRCQWTLILCVNVHMQLTPHPHASNWAWPPSVWKS